MPDSSSKCALVTGAARRIGREIAVALAARGWAVSVHYNSSTEEARAAVEEITSKGGRAASFQADLAGEDEVQGLVPRVAAELGPLGCLINNASVFEDDTPRSATRQSWDRHMEINLRAPFVLSQGFAAQLAPGAAGNIINILDQRVWNLTPRFTSYTLSKSALWSLTQIMAMNLAPAIRVNAIGPGPTLPSIHQSEKDFVRQWQSMPLKRAVALGEISAAVLFILDAPSMTGQMIALDAGQHLGWAPGAVSAKNDE